MNYVLSKRFLLCSISPYRVRFPMPREDFAIMSDNLKGTEVGITRRHFLQASGLTLAALRAALGADNSQLTIGFSTLGCPTWEWSKILEFAQTHGFSAVELRGLQGNMDLPTRPEFQAGRIEATKSAIAANNLKIACVSSSAHLHDVDVATRSQQIAD